jgi:hypothetical protein
MALIDKLRRVPVSLGRVPLSLALIWLCLGSWIMWIENSRLQRSVRELEVPNEKHLSVVSGSLSIPRNQAVTAFMSIGAGEPVALTCTPITGRYTGCLPEELPRGAPISGVEAGVVWLPRDNGRRQVGVLLTLEARGQRVIDYSSQRRLIERDIAVAAERARLHFLTWSVPVALLTLWALIIVLFRLGTWMTDLRSY